MPLHKTYRDLQWFQTLDELLEFHHGKSYLLDNEGGSAIEKHIYELGRYHAIEEEQHSGCASSDVKQITYFVCKSCKLEWRDCEKVWKEDFTSDIKIGEFNKGDEWVDRKDGLFEVCFDCYVAELIETNNFEKTMLSPEFKKEHYERKFKV
jgi:hypothetical protein